MRYLISTCFMVMQTFFIQPAFANEAEQADKLIPVTEQAFVKSINQFSKADIISQFGEPAKADDVKIKGSNKIVASIWLYHFINTTEDGTYYPTTELDFIDDKVVMVAFLNNDGTETEMPVQEYTIPAQ
ncbi:MAG: hypothetical protein CVU29_00225 [Betaproteobacteria bacterium HGW-Betaproteobacteria-22]|nr:MAG: hypothetical protein CVU29_00225 [Betaproteobacteria bacterium HGW-Betaproteobacteria-22]